MTNFGVQYDHPIPVEGRIDTEPERFDSPAGAVDGGQGATRPPAPTVATGGITATVLRPVPHAHLYNGPCVYGDRCGR